MKVATAQLSAGPDEDRVLRTESGVIVLDGATAHDPAIPPAREYVDVLGGELRDRLQHSAPLPDILAVSIAATADRLALRAGEAPSSTVAALRINDDVLEILVLGDSPIIVGRNSFDYDVITDTRLADLDLPESTQYRQRLASGAGFDEPHRRLLRSLQRKQRERRNRDGGYWIAEADPDAAYRAVITHYPAESVDWVIMATDGAAGPLVPLNISWPTVGRMDADDLQRLLEHARKWETDSDPDGHIQPRSKRHDDMTIVVVRP